ncbi:MAG: tetratricopeptide repeat protein [Pseudomonadota bacterium]
MRQRFTSIAAAIVTVFCLSSAATAQAPTLTSNKDELRARQAELFEQLQQTPDSLPLMSLYAKVSIELEDYEAAISTMERMLIYRQDLPTVRRELGVAYFNLGSYQAAKLYLEQVLEQPDLPDEVRANVLAYLAEIEKRTKQNRLQFIASAGIIHSTNANFGPEGLLDTPIGVLPIIEGEEESDTGVRVILALSHDYDLEKANNDIWRTTASFLGIRYFDVEEGNLELIQFRTGPRLSLDEEEFGPKLRPFIDVKYLGVDDTGAYFQSVLGVEHIRTLTPTMSLFGEFGVGFRRQLDSDAEGFDHFRVESKIGLAYIPVRDTILRGSLLIEREEAQDFENTNTEFGIRGGIDYKYSPGLDWVNAQWQASASIDIRGRVFTGSQVSVGETSGRHDIDVTPAVSHIFGINENFAVQFDVNALYRESSIQNFDLDNVSLTLSGVYKL